MNASFIELILLARSCALYEHMCSSHSFKLFYQVEVCLHFEELHITDWSNSFGVMVHRRKVRINFQG